MIKTHITLLLLTAALSKLCTQPQRVGLMSFAALSQRDHLTILFEQLTNKTNTYTASMIVDGTNYTVVGFRPGFYYNDNNEKNTFVDSLTANVTSGQLVMGGMMNYSYGANPVTKGTAFVKGPLAEFSFTKEVKSTKNYVEWDPVLIENITMPSDMLIERSDPPLPAYMKRTFEKLLNDQLETKNGLKQTILKEMNSLYAASLKERLNSEDIINSANVVYNYNRTLNLTYVNEVYYLSLYDDGGSESGLKYQYLFELENYMQGCNVLPLQPDPAFGGVQELIGLEVFRATFLYGLKAGIFNTVLDQKWENSVFQFYVGDIANAIDELSSLPPNKPVTGACFYDSTLAGMLMAYQSQNSIVFRIPYRCNLTMDNNKLIKEFTFNATFDVQFVNSVCNIATTQRFATSCHRSGFHRYGKVPGRCAAL